MVKLGKTVQNHTLGWNFFIEFQGLQHLPVEKQSLAVYLFMLQGMPNSMNQIFAKKLLVFEKFCDFHQNCF